MYADEKNDELAQEMESDGNVSYGNRRDEGEIGRGTKDEVTNATSTTQTPTVEVMDV